MAWPVENTEATDRGEPAGPLEECETLAPNVTCFVSSLTVYAVIAVLGFNAVDGATDTRPRTRSPPASVARSRLVDIRRVDVSLGGRATEEAFAQRPPRGSFRE